ncbi:MAG: protein-L-isoaspartate(D-aspartate) O-methyltransferase [bacterium]|nr:protein-L-isoaspartate(D-aspartate) O-methyltransferase [bacterium]
MMQSIYSKAYFEDMRKKMVEEQIVARGVTDERVLSAMNKVERHNFVPELLWGDAYKDYPLPIGNGQTISQPYMAAIMTEELALESADRVLEIGTGSGYQTAILAEIVKEVYSVERVESLANDTMIKLKEMGYNNIFVKKGDGSKGWKEYSPFDKILVTAGTNHIPEFLFEQLKEGGKIVIPVGDEYTQELTVVTKVNGEMQEKKLFECVFVPLIED